MAGSIEASCRKLREVATITDNAPITRNKSRKAVGQCREEIASCTEPLGYVHRSYQDRKKLSVSKADE